MTKELELREEKKEASALVATAKAHIVRDLESANRASEYIGASKTLQARIRDFFKEHKEIAWAAHKKLVAHEQEELAPLIQVEDIVKEKVGTWRREEQAKADEARAKA